MVLPAPWEHQPAGPGDVPRSETLAVVGCFIASAVMVALVILVAVLVLLTTFG